ncbi:MAG: hypothetical protein M1298_02315 [Chloroflexi bacterium]|nr:hypothetical protein [Chloroflexota bacterium]
MREKSHGEWSAEDNSPKRTTRADTLQFALPGITCLALAGIFQLVLSTHWIGFSYPAICFALAGLGALLALGLNEE